MQKFFDENAPKKATNLSVNSDLLLKARGLKINLSATLENALAQQVRKAARKDWLIENKEAIRTLNDLAENNGLFSDLYREL
jgi:antitoxin CcdA